MSWASSRGHLPEQSTTVRGRPAATAPVVTQLVTQPAVGSPAGTLLGVVELGLACDHRPMAYNVYERYTQLMRTNSLDLWRRLRVLLAEQGIDPQESVLVNLFPDGGNDEFGQIISQEDRVYCFSLAYDREQKDGAEHAVIRNWTEITDGWQRRSLAIETADAFIWRVPRRPSDLSL